MIQNKAESHKTFKQLIKYAVVGILNTLVTLISFWFLNTCIEFSYGISNAIAYVLGVINSFVWNRTWVFKAHNNIGREAALFVVGYMLCYGLQIMVSWFLLEGLDWKSLPQDVIPFFPMAKAGQNITMVVAMGFYTIANYIYNRFVTFKEQKQLEK